MAITITWGTKVIHVQRADMPLLQASPEKRELDTDVFRLALKDLEDSEDGMPFPRTHNHQPPVSIGGLELARVVEIVNGYTVEFEDAQYAVDVTGANTNIGDVKVQNQVSVNTANSAGLVKVGSGLSSEQDAAITAIKAKTDQLAFTVANLLDANTRAVQGQNIAGAGTEGDPWGP